MYIDYYERTYTSKTEAEKTAAETGGKISSFYSMDEAGETILIYCVRYPQLF